MQCLHDRLSVLFTVAVVRELPESSRLSFSARNCFAASSAPRYAVTCVMTGLTVADRVPVQDEGSDAPAVRLSTANLIGAKLSVWVTFCTTVQPAGAVTVGTTGSEIDTDAIIRSPVVTPDGRLMV